MKPKPILLDVDAGVDDTLAVIFALLSPRLDVRAITTVAGNVSVASCTRNVLLTLRILSLSARSYPSIARGASAPLVGKLFTAKEVHGSDGIGGASAFYPPVRSREVRGNAVDLILKIARDEPDLTLVATGPLTNVALALIKDYPAMRKVREIVVMGGGFKGAHNTGPCAEFNFYVDPLAADLVMRSGIPVRLIPLNVTELCIFRPADLRSIAGQSIRRFLQRVTKSYFEFHKRTRQLNGGYLHDPLAVAAVAEPSLLKTAPGYVRVEWSGRYTRGQSVFFPRLDVRREAQLPPWVSRAIAFPPTVKVADWVNSEKFKELFLKTILASEERDNGPLR